MHANILAMRLLPPSLTSDVAATFFFVWTPSGTAVGNYCSFGGAGQLLL